jgi:hypothetical protein
MSRTLDPFRFILIAVAGWMNQRQSQAIDYLREENRVLREQLGDRRLLLTDDQRRRLAVKASCRPWFDWASTRCVFAQRVVDTVRLVITDVFADEVAKVFFGQFIGSAHDSAAGISL